MSTLNDTDLFVIERSGTQYQVRSDEMSTLNDTDLFVVEREGVQYKVEAVDVVVDPITGEFETPVEVLTPLNGAGIGSGVPYNPISSSITVVGAGGVSTCETELIESVDATTDAPNVILTFPSAQGFDCFEPGDVVQESQSDSAININQSGASINHSDPKGLPSSFYNDLPTISYQQIRDASLDQWNDVFKPNIGQNFTYQMIELEYAVTSIQFTTQGSYIMTACSVDGVTWEQLEQSPAGQTATTRTATGGPFKYWYIGFNADTGDNTNNYYLSCNAKAYIPVKVISIDDSDPYTITVDGGEWSNGDTLSKASTFDASLTCSDSTELANMVGPISMTDENGDLVTPQTSEIVGVDESEITYSSYMSAGANMTLAFDGDLATYSYPITANETIDWDYTPTLPYNTIKIYCSYSGTQNGSPSFKINDVECLDILQNYTGGDLYLSESQLAAKGITSPLYSIEITSSSNNGNSALLNGIEINGRLLQDGDTKVELTFEDSTDLQYFSAGDVVQAEFTSEVIEGSAPSNIFGAVDGNEATFSQNIDSNQNTYQWTIPNGVNVTKVEVIVSKTGGTSGNDFYINNCQVTRSFESSLNSSPQTFDVTSYSDTNGNTIGSTFNNFRLVNAQGTAPNLRIHGIILNDEILAVVKVVSVDPDNSQMVVDGGEWVAAPNQDEVWSNSVTIGSNNIYSDGGGIDKTPDRMFDGVLNTQCVPEKGAASSEVSLEVAFSLPSVTKIRVYSVNVDVCYVNGGSSVTATDTGWNTIYDGAAISLSTLKIERTSGVSSGDSGTGFVVSAIEINGRLLVDQGVSVPGDTFISLPTLEASATDVVGVDGNTLQIDGVSGTWKTGLHIKGASISSSAPSPNSVVFTSSNGGTTAVTGTDATLTSRVWTLEKSSTQTGPWTVVGEYTDTSANASQDGATPWSGKPDLEANTFYQVKVKYTSDNANPVESVFNTFKTGDA